VIVAATRAGTYEQRICLRCFEGRVYEEQRDASVACERCSEPRGWWFTSTLGQSSIHTSVGCDPLWSGVPSPGLRRFCAPGWGLGRGNRRSRCWVRIPSRKIRTRFQERKVADTRPRSPEASFETVWWTDSQ
jgi:hypothetical protein